MSLLPQMGDLAPPVVVRQRQPCRTYHLDFAAKRIAGFVDGQDAARQAVMKLLLTEEGAHEIYTGHQYGIAIADLLGQERFIVEAELKRRLRESLERDDRVVRVHGISISGGLDDLLVRLAVDTIYGQVQLERRLLLA